jgi:hypothetical protein
MPVTKPKKTIRQLMAEVRPVEAAAQRAVRQATRGSRKAASKARVTKKKRAA